MGRFVAIAGDAMPLEVEGMSRTVPLDRVACITRTRRGSVLGTILGPGAGIPLGLAARTYARNEARSPTQAFLPLGGIGAASGIAIDTLNLPRTMYDRERQRPISIGPRAGRVCSERPFGPPSDTGPTRHAATEAAPSSCPAGSYADVGARDRTHLARRV